MANQPYFDIYAEMLIEDRSGGSGGATSYNQLTNLPVINGITVKGSKIASDYNLATNTGLDAVREIAEGAQQAKAFASYQALVTDINDYAETELKTGWSIYIQTLNVPDLWVYSVEETSIPYTYTTDQAIINALDTTGYIQVGYFKLSKLETGKVNMDDYVLKTTKVNGETLDDDVVVTFSNLGGNPSDNEELVTLVNSRVQDVQINGTSIKVDGVANIPIASNNNVGLFLTTGSGGINIGSSGNAVVYSASDVLIEEKTNQYRPIVPSNLDKAVMEGLGNNSLTWSDAYKTSAQNTIGIATEQFVFTMADGTELTKNIKVSS